MDLTLKRDFRPSNAQTERPLSRKLLAVRHD
jgi:hypothetical protein